MDIVIIGALYLWSLAIVLIDSTIIGSSWTTLYGYVTGNSLFLRVWAILVTLHLVAFVFISLLILEQLVWLSQ